MVLLCFGSYFAGNGRKQAKSGENSEFWDSDAGGITPDAGGITPDASCISLSPTGAEISASELKTVITFDS